MISPLTAASFHSSNQSISAYNFPATDHDTLYLILQGSFAFIDFDNEGDAEKAKNGMIGKNMGGLNLNIGK